MTSNSQLSRHDNGEEKYQALAMILLGSLPIVTRPFQRIRLCSNGENYAKPHALQRREDSRLREPHMILGKPANIPVLLLGLGLFIVKESIKVIGEANTMLIERFGVFNRRLNAGLHFTIPLVERASYESTLREQVLDIPPQQCITKDNAPLSADAVVYWKVVDPERSRYAVKDLVIALQNLVLTQLRSEIGKLTLDDTFSARQQINSILLEDLDRSIADWGVKVTRVEVRDIIPSQDILSAMEMQMSAERKKRAAILDSEGRREAQVNDARGKADAVRLQAEAEANRLEAVARGEALVNDSHRGNGGVIWTGLCSSLYLRNIGLLRQGSLNQTTQKCCSIHQRQLCQ